MARGWMLRDTRVSRTVPAPPRGLRDNFDPPPARPCPNRCLDRERVRAPSGERRPPGRHRYWWWTPPPSVRSGRRQSARRRIDRAPRGRHLALGLGGPDLRVSDRRLKTYPVGASMRSTACGRCPLHPGATSAKLAAPVPLVGLPGTANTSVHISSIGSMKYRPPVSAVEITTGPSVRSSHALE